MPWRQPRSGSTAVAVRHRHGRSQLVLVDLDDGTVTALEGEGDTRALAFPRWSPDGSSIAFISSRDGNREVYVMDIDGDNPRRMTTHDERDDYVSWHPNGRQLVVVAERRGRHDLYLIPVD